MKQKIDIENIVFWIVATVLISLFFYLLITGKGFE